MAGGIGHRRPAAWRQIGVEAGQNDDAPAAVEARRPSGCGVAAPAPVEPAMITGRSGGLFAQRCVQRFCCGEAACLRVDASCSRRCSGQASVTMSRKSAALRQCSARSAQLAGSAVGACSSRRRQPCRPGRSARRVRRLRPAGSAGGRRLLALGHAPVPGPASPARRAAAAGSSTGGRSSTSGPKAAKPSSSSMSPSARISGARSDVPIAR